MHSIIPYNEYLERNAIKSFGIAIGSVATYATGFFAALIWKETAVQLFKRWGIWDEDRGFVTGMDIFWGFFIAITSIIIAAAVLVALIKIIGGK